MSLRSLAEIGVTGVFPTQATFRLRDCRFLGMALPPPGLLGFVVGFAFP